MTVAQTDAVLESTTQLSGPGFQTDILCSDHNRRIQVLSYEATDFETMVQTLRQRAEEHGYDKVFLKAPPLHRPALESTGLEAEAEITGYFAGDDAVVMSLFLSDERREQPYLDRQEQILESIRERPADPALPELPEGYRMELAQPEHAGDPAGPTHL